MIESSTGPGDSLRDALWETGNTINQSHVLWYDPTPQWAPGVAYRWRLQRDPDSGRIRVRWYEVSAFLFFLEVLNKWPAALLYITKLGPIWSLVDCCTLAWWVTINESPKGNIDLFFGYRVRNCYQTRGT